MLGWLWCIYRVISVLLNWAVVHHGECWHSHTMTVNSAWKQPSPFVCRILWVRKGERYITKATAVIGYHYLWIHVHNTGIFEQVPFYKGCVYGVGGGGGWRWGILPMISYTGKLGPKGVPFFRLGYKKRYGKTSFLVFERVTKTLTTASDVESHWYLKGAKTGSNHHLRSIT